MNRKCTRCLNVYPLNEGFYKRSGKRSHEHYSYCKKCFVKSVTNRWIRLKKESIEYKGGKCLDCNGIFHYAVYDFHHRDPETKEDNWREIRKWKEPKRKAELDKCDLLCANCHRVRHVEQTNKEST